MNILILTGYDDNIKELGDACAVGQREYAERNGYAFEVVRSYEEGSHPSWQKLRILKERIGKYDAICWFDADTVITNCDVKIENLISPNHILTLSADWCAPVDEPDETARFISMGNFILRNTKDTIKFLDMAATQEQFKNRPCWEQDAVLTMLRRDKWFDGQIARLPRGTMNAVDKDVANASRVWQHGDLLCHLTGLGAAEHRLARIPRYDAIRRAGFTPETDTSWIPEWWESGSCMDKRHILALRNTLTACGVQSAIEIGSYSGASSSAFQRVPNCVFVDPAPQGRLHEVIRGIPGGRYVKARGADFLASVLKQPAVDLIFVDGAHDLDSVTEELDVVLANPPKVIAAHDVNSTRVGFPYCEGAEYLRAELLRQGWLCCWDQNVRDGEKTERGFFLATRDPGTFETLKQVLRDTCGGYETEL